MKREKRMFLVFTLSMLMTTGTVAPSHAAHPADVTLRDINAASVAGTANAYSPKRTCGTTACHADMADGYGLTHNIYESGIAFAAKDHGIGSPSYGNPYQVPYAQHGVSAGYHFQQGRNVSWSDPQRTYYAMPAFTSSPGMFGKY
jgi:hypothetical protein